MIQKLKWRFVLVLMLVVTLLLAAVFGAVYQVARTSARRTADEVLRKSLAGINAGYSPLYDPQSDQVPHFTVSISPLGQVSLLSGNLRVDDDLLLQICAACLAQEAAQGELAGFGLRYMRVSVYGELRLAFADMSFESSILHGLTRGLLIAGTGALAVFFGLSVLLSTVAVRPIRRAWEQQKQFVADASHELNTPLTVISSNLELMAESAALDPESQTRIERVRTESDRMKQLTDGLLALARAESGAQADRAAAARPMDASALAMRQALLFEPLFFEGGFGFDYKIEQKLESRGSESQFTQLVSILLDNARKHAAPGSAVTLTLVRESRRAATLTVRNFGTVIPPEQLAHIFERFYRADPARSAEGGYGLGLSIARAIAQTNKWTLRAESTAEQGTAFILTLPVRPG